MSDPDEHTDTDNAAALRSDLVWWRTLALALLAVGAVVAFLLVREVRSHKADNARFEILQQQLDALGASLLGSHAENLTLIDAAGTPSQTSFASAPLTLVILLSEHCSACEASAPAWSQAAARLAAEGVPTVMIVTDATSTPTPSPRWASLPPHAARDADRTWLRHVPGVPAGVLVDTTGTIRRLWLRPITGSEVDDVVKAAVGELARGPG